MSDIFFSHVEEDRELVVSVADGLEQAGYTTWYYERDSLPGIPFVRQLPGVIDGAQAVVVVISADALGSPHVYSEIVEAYKIGKPFIPLLLDLSHAEFRRQRRDWALMLGAAVFVTVPAVNVSDIVPRILVGLAQMHLRPSGTPSAATTHATPSAPPPKPAPKPVMAPAATPRGALNVATSGNRISNLRKEQWETALTSTPTATPKLPDNPVKTSRRRFVRTFVPVALLGGGFAYWNFIRDRRVAALKQVAGFVHGAEVLALAVHPTQPLIATGGVDGIIRLWDIDRPDSDPYVLDTNDHIRSAAFSRDGSLLATGSYDPTFARLWDTQTWQPIGAPLEHDDEVYSVAFNLDGTFLATGCRDGIARAWDVELRNAPSRRFDAAVQAVGFHPSTFKIATGDDTGMVQLWNPEVDETDPPSYTHDGGIRVVAFSPDGSTLASGAEDKKVKLWNLHQLDKAPVPLQHNQIVRGVAFHSDGSMLATGSSDGVLRLWELNDPIHELTQVSAHLPRVRVVAFVPNASRLVTVGDDNMARMWEYQ